MPTAITPLANITLGSAAASVTFSSIVGTYRDLILISKIGNTTNNDIRISFNGDNAGSNYFMTFGSSDGSSPYAGGDSGYPYVRISLAYPYNDNATGLSINVMDYAQTNKQKAGLLRIGGTRGVQMESFRWASTAAITTMMIEGSSGNLTSGSTFALYGVSA